MNSLPRALLALVFAVVMWAAPAVAQVQWPAPDGKQASGYVGMCLNGAGKAVAVSSGGCASGTPVVPPLPLAPVTGQVKIAVTGTAVQLPAAVLLNGVVVKAKSSNAAQTATVSGTVGSAGVTNVADGTGTGYLLAPGEASSFAVPNANALYVNGTAGDIFTFEGN